MKKSLVAAVISIFTCGATQAGMNIEAISLELSKAASSHDLAAARELSSKQIDGSMFRLKAEPVEIGYDEFEPAESEELELSESKKLMLKADVPGLAESEGKNAQSKDDGFFGLPEKVYGKFKNLVNNDVNGFSEHMIRAIAMPVALPIVLAVRGARNGTAFRQSKKIPPAVITGINAVGGFVTGAIITPIVMLGDITFGLIDLFQGNL